MGAFCHIEKNPKEWIIFTTDCKLKPEYGEEELYKVRYGVFDDEPGGQFDLEMYMRKSIFQKAISGKYRVSKESKSKKRLILLDFDEHEIKPLIADICY